jgi:5-formyltetrahydrofolate cyclo-ligase
MSDTSPKAPLRAEAAERRAQAAAAHPLAGQTLAAVFPAGLIPPSGSVVAGYWPFRSEIDPRPLLERVSRLGLKAALPVTPPKGSDEALSFRLWDPTHDLARGHFGVHEPPAHAATVEPDLVLVPMLAFDLGGHRLGYGAGHYDRTLERLRALKPVTAIGLAFAAQQVQRLPADPHDQKLDGVVTERAYIAFRKDH